MVFDAGQNSALNFAHLVEVGLHFVGSLPPSEHPGLLAIPSRRRSVVDAERYPGLTAYVSGPLAPAERSRLTVSARKLAGPRALPALPPRSRVCRTCPVSARVASSGCRPRTLV